MPYVYPLTGVTDLLGRMPVRLTAEDQDLVAYGFGDQRIAIPGAEIGAVVVHPGWGKQWGRSGPALVVLDKHDQMLLRARGRWGATEYDGFGRLCSALKIVRPLAMTLREARQQKPRWPQAPGYRKLRTRPHGYYLVRLAVALLGAVLGILGITAAVLLANVLPWDTGTVRNLIGIALGVAALWAVIWLCGVALRALNWLAVSLSVGSVAPPDRFFGRDPRRGRIARTWLTVLMVLAIPALIGWGPVIGLLSLTHGFSDQALVSTLRSSGVSTTGAVIDVPTYSTDSDGNTVVSDHPTLSFQTHEGLLVRTPDPAIAGWTWPMNPDQPVTIVYDPAQPATAAVAGQISGSPWHGAPAGNLIAGALLTVALLPLTWLTVRRIQAARRESREGFFDGFS
jgi:hypothetical protein